MSKEKQINACKNSTSYKEEKIKELAKDLCNSIVWTDLDGEPLIDAEQTCAALYNIGYRKQSEGEWIDSLNGYCQCSNCRTSFETRPTTFLFKLNNSFCRNCGAKMKGDTYAI